MRHDFHYVEELSHANRPVGKIIPIDRIEPNPEQPRNEFGDLSELSASIKEKGVLEPLLVKPTSGGKFMIIAGERRWRASGLAGLQEVPCIELDIDEQGIAEIALIENLQRKDLTIWEEADGLAALADKFGYTQEEIAKKISKSRTTVTELMTVASLPAKIREKCRAANISSKSTLLEVARQFDEEAMLKLTDTLTNGSRDRETVKKAARAERTAPITLSNGNEKRKTFRYSPKNSEFTLNIDFKKWDQLSRNGVLKALKDTFDLVKNEEIDI
jgi:ParB family chromosome partitioning protein